MLESKKDFFFFLNDMFVPQEYSGKVKKSIIGFLAGEKKVAVSLYTRYAKMAWLS